MGTQAHYTHIRSHLESQPHSDRSGNLLVFDGRLDNYKDIQNELQSAEAHAADGEIILQAYQRWGQDCFKRLIGDWALALWDAGLRTLYLARDHAGTRTLYYSKDSSGALSWSTYLDSLLSTDLLGAHDSIYMASYLAMLPCHKRSPYRDVHPIPPGHVLRATARDLKITQVWSPFVREELHYRSDRDYELQFLALFSQSVARRTEPGNPVIAQLSGGMDSTSIVCMSDHLRTLKSPSDELLDTVSYYDNSEPAWNEMPYFTIVEKNRGKRGIHIDSGVYRDSLEKPPDLGASYLFPGINSTTIMRDKDFDLLTGGDKYRAILSGIGGDEMTGGTPNSCVALADYVSQGNVFAATRHAIAWCLADRLCLIDACTKSFSLIRSLGAEAAIKTWRNIPWLTQKTRNLCQEAVHELPLVGYRPFVSRPSAVDACNSWWFMLRTQPHLKPSEVHRYEYLYPYLDRDLVEFLLSLPQEQLSRPGRRRALMRRTLVDIVPR